MKAFLFWWWYYMKATQHALFAIQMERQREQKLQ